MADGYTHPYPPPIPRGANGSMIGRPAPPIGPAPPRRAPPPRSIRGDASRGDEPEQTISPHHRIVCIAGLAVQASLDVVVLMLVFYTGGAFFTVPVAGFCLALDGALLVWAVMASPLPIDVLIKNALSGVAWFMLCVINGVVISDAHKPYAFIACTVVMVFSLCFWVWSLWWGLNDPGSRSKLKRKSEKRCSGCRRVGDKRPSRPCFHSKDCESGFALRPIAPPPSAQLPSQYHEITRSGDKLVKRRDDEAFPEPAAAYDRHASCFLSRQRYIPRRDSYVSRPDGYTPRPDNCVPSLDGSTSPSSTGETEAELVREGDSVQKA